MGMLLILISLLFTTWSASTNVHDYHLSNTEVRYNQEEQALQITTRIFIDDLEQALADQGHSKLFLCLENEAAHADSLVGQYLFDNIFISINDKQVYLSYLGKEISDDLAAVWCYLEISDVELINALEIENNVLLKTFGDQKNIINLKLDKGMRKMLVLENGKSSGKVML